MAHNYIGFTNFTQHTAVDYNTGFYTFRFELSSIIYAPYHLGVVSDLHLEVFAFTLAECPLHEQA